jgi:hypothetical protein
MTNLSPAAEAALINTNRCQGAPIPCDPETRAELEAHKLIGPGGGITGTGLIARGRVLDAKLDAAF